MPRTDSRLVLTITDPDRAIEAVVELMKDKAIRRLPVVEHDRPIGVVSIGDLARARDPDSALGQISATEPNT